MKGKVMDTCIFAQVFTKSAKIDEKVECSCFTLTNGALPFLLLGFVAGIIATKCTRLSRKKEKNEEVVAERSNVVKQNEEDYRVLNGAISLFSNKFSLNSRQFSLNEQDGNNVNVVTYLSPEDMMKTLFPEELTTQNKKSNNIGDLSLSLNHALGTEKKEQAMVNLLEQVQKYSVNTDHPYFFNQLFGALDPISVAAELVALSVNTSAYTYETAPVFTLIERHVIEKLAQLVYPSLDLKKNGYDGLMLPGGSLSNLTAIHAARHICSIRIPERRVHIRCENENHFSESYQEEKKDNAGEYLEVQQLHLNTKPTLVAFVSDEAHYSFSKSAKVAGIGSKNMVVVPTLQNGQMDVEQLDALMTELLELNDNRVPFFVGVTAGSTVRGSFDDIKGIIDVCRKHEIFLDDRSRHDGIEANHKIWVHVDGAWGGSAIFSGREDIRKLLNGVSDADSFTFNPHKMLGAPQQTSAFVTRHKGVLQASNSTNAKYLFDKRKNGAEYDLGDGTFTCGRKTDSIKLWAMWKYYGSEGLGLKVETKVDSLALFSQMIKESDCFMLACEPWPFNVNFFYLPKRIRKIFKERNVDIYNDSSVVPNDLASDLANVHVELKCILHKSGEMLIPFQPLSNQKADCFRVVLAGDKRFNVTDMHNVLGLLDRKGSDL